MKLLLTSLLTLTVATSFSQWTSLFDGKTLKGWHRMAGTAEYKVVDGTIVGTTIAGSPNTFLVADKKYSGDFVLEMEVMMDDSLTNSGIQFKSNYDAGGNKGNGKIFGYQFELDPSMRQWSGGVYDEARREWLYPMSMHSNAQKLFTPAVWHKVRIQCKGNEITTWLDDIASAYVIDTLNKNEGLIGLQVHAINKPEHAGINIRFKNIRINTTGQAIPFPKNIYVANLVPNHLSKYEVGNGWKLLFDGKSSNGWKGAYSDGFPAKGWEVKDGVLSVLSSEGKEAANGGDIVTLEKFSAFDLSFEFKLTPGANSGVKYFVTLSEHNVGSAIGLEYQLLDDTLHPDAKLGRDGNRTLASVYDLIKAEKTSRFIHQPGSWNTGRIIVYPNNHVEHYLNGIKVLEYDRGSDAYRQLVAISKYKDWKSFGEANEGYLLLQDHGNAVSFKSIKVKRLK
jgi:hypothetical protein